MIARKKTKVKLGLKNFAMLQNYFDYVFGHLRQKVRLRPETFVNLRPEPKPDPKSPARLTTLLCFTNLINVYLSQKLNEKIATANIQPYFMNLARNYNLTLSLYHFLQI